MQRHDENMPHRTFLNEDLNQTTQVKTLLMIYLRLLQMEI